MVPDSVPDVIRPEESLGLDFSGGQEGGVPGGVPEGVVGAIVGGLPQSALSSAPPPPPVRPGGDIRRPVKVRDVRPEYPDLALKARIEGTVILECTISTEGRVSEVRVLRGVPLLDDAAVEAVRRWVYTPTLLNGVPVPVVMTVTVDFNLRGGG
jgi:protein TonB